MAKVYKGVTLDELNSSLLQRLDDLVQNADGEEILKLTECIAKLNASWKGNDQFGKPESAEERKEREHSQIFGEVLKGEVIEGEVDS